MKKMMFATILLVGSLFTGCNENKLLEPEFSIIDGNKIEIFYEDVSMVYNSLNKNYGLNLYKDTTLFYKGTKLPEIPKVIPDLSNIKNNIELKGKSFRMIATGGSLMAGMKAGGYYNEAMETSVPNLIARQMGIDFKQPYFDLNDYNGIGRVATTKTNLTGGPVQKYNVVRNNLGIQDKDAQGRVNLKAFAGERIDNFAGSEFYGYDYTAGEYQNYYNPIIDRIIENNKSITLRERILKEKFDFIIEGTGYFDIRSGISHNMGNFTNGFDSYLDKKPSGIVGVPQVPVYNDRLSFLLALKNRGNIKGLLINPPDRLNLPIYKIISPIDVELQFRLFASEHLLPTNKIGLVIPTSKMDSLMGKNVNVNLKPWISDGKKMKDFDDHISQEAIAWSNLSQKVFLENSNLAKQLNFALLDLDALYKRILSNSYTSHDGIKIDVKNFFEVDGYSPTDLGNLIIANEAIIAINKQYNLKISLISTREFLNK